MPMKDRLRGVADGTFQMDPGGYERIYHTPQQASYIDLPVAP